MERFTKDPKGDVFAIARPVFIAASTKIKSTLDYP